MGGQPEVQDHQVGQSVFVEVGDAAARGVDAFLRDRHRRLRERKPRVAGTRPVDRRHEDLVRTGLRHTQIVREPVAVDVANGCTRADGAHPADDVAQRGVDTVGGLREWRADRMDRRHREREPWSQARSLVPACERHVGRGDQDGDQDDCRDPRGVGAVRLRAYDMTHNASGFQRTLRAALLGRQPESADWKSAAWRPVGFAWRPSARPCTACLLAAPRAAMLRSLLFNTGITTAANRRSLCVRSMCRCPPSIGRRRMRTRLPVPDDRLRCAHQSSFSSRMCASIRRPGGALWRMSTRPLWRAHKRLSR